MEAVPDVGRHDEGRAEHAILMPVVIRKKKGGYSVSTPGGVKAKRTSLKKALAQKRIIEAAERGEPVRSSFKKKRMA